MLDFTKQDKARESFLWFMRYHLSGREDGLQQKERKGGRE